MVLPAPFGPSSTVTVPRGTTKARSLTATTSPNVRQTPVSATAGADGSSGILVFRRRADRNEARACNSAGAIRGADYPRRLRRRSRVVQARVCKTLDTGSIPVAASRASCARHDDTRVRCQSSTLRLDLAPEGVDAGVPLVRDLLEGLVGLPLHHLELGAGDHARRRARPSGGRAVMSRPPASTSVGARSRGRRSVVSWSRKRRGSAGGPRSSACGGRRAPLR